MNPVESPPWAMSFLEKNYSGNDGTTNMVTKQKSLPKGWQLVPAPPDDAVREKVIKIYPWGTHMLVLDGGNSYCTAKGDNPGSLESIWDYTKFPGAYALKGKYGARSSHHGNFMIRRKL